MTAFSPEETEELLSRFDHEHPSPLGDGLRYGFSCQPEDSGDIKVRITVYRNDWDVEEEDDEHDEDSMEFNPDE